MPAVVPPCYPLCMANFRRHQVETIVQRLTGPPSLIVAVTGPRQTGKTTAARQALASMGTSYRYAAVDAAGPPATRREPGRRDAVQMYELLPEATDRGWLVGVWRESRLQAQKENGFVLAIDEIHKIDGWSETVKGLWDADRATGCPLHVMLLGSAPLLVQAGANESLAGRFETVRFTHWSYLEMSEAFGFSLDEFIHFGGYPGPARMVGEPERWTEHVREALIKPVIERDMLSMTRVDKPALLSRLFDVGVRHSGQLLSYNKMLGYLQDAGNTTTLTHYLKLLSDAGLLTGLPSHDRPASAKDPTPKLNVLNTAVMPPTTGYSFEEARSDRSYWGRVVESAVGAHLLNTASTRTSVKYWRYRGQEVDFVLHRGPKVVGIEVKSGKAHKAPSGLAAFQSRFRHAAVLVVGADVGLEEFLSHPADHWVDSA